MVKIKGEFIVKFETDFSDDKSDINTAIYQMRESLLEDGWKNVEVKNNVVLAVVSKNDDCVRATLIDFLDKNSKKTHIYQTKTKNELVDDGFNIL